MIADGQGIIKVCEKLAISSSKLDTSYDYPGYEITGKDIFHETRASCSFQ